MSAEQRQRVQPGSREEMRQIRMSSNWVNMAIALGACLAVVIVAFAFVPQLDNELKREVDYVGMAETAQSSADFTLAVPSLLDGWVSNEASLEPMGDPATDTWYVSWVGPEREWVTLRQARGDEKWITSVVGENMLLTGEREIAGQTFDAYEGQSGEQALVGEADGTSIVLRGTATWESFDHYAEQTVSSLAP